MAQEQEKKTFGFVVELFMPDADPNGVRLVNKHNWSGEGIVIPRTLFSKEKGRKQLQRPGVYLLIGRDEEKNEPKMYIGEGDPIIDRLTSHFNDRPFWTHLVAFTVSDGVSLNKTHIQHLESRLYHLAVEAKQCILDNTQRPTEPTTTDSVRAVAEAYLADLLLCLPVVGVTLFEPPPKPLETIAKYEIVSVQKKAKAKGFDSTQGFVVLKGSEITKSEAPQIPAHLKQKRATLLSQGVMVDRGTHFELVDDYTFDSPSMAAGVVLGNSSNGRWLWRNAEGVSLGDVEKKEVEHILTLSSVQYEVVNKKLVDPEHNMQ